MRRRPPRSTRTVTLFPNTTPFRSRRWDRTGVRSGDLLDIVRAALAEVARSDPQAVMRLLRDLRPEAHITSLHLLLETVATNAQGLRDLLVEQLDNPGLFKAGWYGADEIGRAHV